MEAALQVRGAVASEGLLDHGCFDGVGQRIHHARPVAGLRDQLVEFTV